MLNVLRLIVPLLVISQFSGCLVGCGAPQAMPREFGEAVRVVANTVSDQAILDKLILKTRGHISHPGIRTSAGIEYFAEVKLINVDGDVEIAGDGHGSGVLTDSGRSKNQALIENRYPTLADELNKALDAEAARLRARQLLDQGGAAKTP